MLLEGNNVYGIITAPQALQTVLDALRDVRDWDRADVYRSQFNGAETLHLRSASAEFDSEPLQDRAQHLVNGAVGGPLVEVVAFVQELSDALSRRRIEHVLEVYDEGQLVQRMPK